MKKYIHHFILLAFLAITQMVWAQQLTGSGILRDDELPCLPSHGRNDNVTAWCGEEIATQTIQFVQGQNWFSTNVDIALEDLQNALREALPSAGNRTIKIKSQRNGECTNLPSTWPGSLKVLDVTQMYKITVPSACEITLEGAPVNPADHPITIKNGANWIGFPLLEQMTVTNAFAGFAVKNDVVKSQSLGQAKWNNTIWTGALKNLVPGQGYIYQSQATEDRTFTYPSSTK